MSLTFQASKQLTLGVELELQLINLQDHNLAQDSQELLRRLSKIDFPGAVKPEITKSMIELNTIIHSKANEVENELQRAKDILIHESSKIDLGICGGGTHSFHKWSEQKIYPSERYNSILQLYGYLAKQFTVFGQHIHIGCQSGDEAIKLCHAFTRYLPHFVALSAASPFYQNVDTGFDTSRLNIISSFPNSGTLPDVMNWNEFEDYYYRLIEMRIIEGIKDLYWDIRPKPEFGTVEIRICDTPLTIRRAVELTAYAQAIAAYLQEQPLYQTIKDLYIVYKYNKFQAARFGLGGDIIDPGSGEIIKISEDIKHTIELLKPYIEQLESREYINSIIQTTSQKRNDAAWLREQYAQVKSFPDLVSNQVKLWASKNA
jgi:glutamate---cysteine ligase / carboxylate-amine ligase